MSHHLTDEEYKSQKRAVWKATLILGIVTFVEIGFALAHYYEIAPFSSLSKGLLSGLMIVLSLLKAYFIVGEFMHIRYEMRALTLTILVPLVFLVYGVIMFMMEGNAWNIMRIPDSIELRVTMVGWIFVLAAAFGSIIGGGLFFTYRYRKNTPKRVPE